jgi:diguanylate cyclase (GGDEF)-like protein
MVCRHLPQNDTETYLCFPVVALGQVLALVSIRMPSEVASRLEGRSSQLETKEVADSFCERIGLSLANLQLRERLWYHSVRDPLTGLFNRAYLEQTLQREFSSAVRQRTSIGIIMLDIDHFKSFNDTFGHAAGDLLLTEVGSFLESSVRKEDVACRYGGEEFVLVLPRASLENTAKRAEQIRVRIHDLHITHEDRPLGPVSFSLGVASFPRHGLGAKEVLRQADLALYQAKAEGRDKVVMATS